MVNYFIFEWYITDKSQIKHCFSSLASWHDSCFVRLLSHKVIVPLHPSPPSLWLYLSAGLLCLHLPRSFLQLSLLYDFIVSWCRFQSELLFFHIYSIRAVVIWFLLRLFCILLGIKICLQSREIIEFQSQRRSVLSRDWQIDFRVKMKSS